MKRRFPPVKPTRPGPPPRLTPKPRSRRVPEQFLLRLFVAGATTQSSLAVRRVRELCAAELAGGCQLAVIDIYQQPELARTNQIVATPTLVIDLPRPVRRFIGNLANIAGLFVDLQVSPREKVAL